MSRGYIVVHPVWDHEEWMRLARDAEGGIFLAQGSVVRDETNGGYLSDPLEVEGALRVVAKHERWTLADVGGPIVSGPKQQPADVDGFGTQMEGGCWLVVPIDYLKGATHPGLVLRPLRGPRDRLLGLGGPRQAVRGPLGSSGCQIRQ